MESNGRVHIVAVSDYICPWCYVGSARMERLRQEFDVDVEWWPYELHPEIPVDGILREPTSRRAAFYDQLRALATDAGLPFERPPVVANSHRALEAAEFAREHGVFEAMHRELFHAYFAEGRNIGDIDVLIEIAGVCGLDGDALREAIDARRYASLIDQRTAQAREAGITSTPTFVFIDGERRFPLPGCQDYPVFENVARRFGARERTPQAAS
jgi:predicted DsbA family dithiol-disulfide isomerase